MGTGKTAVSRELSRLTGSSQVEVDIGIEKSAGMSIAEIFSKFGESRFRQMETDEIKKVSGKANLIISTGGGAVLREENMEALRRGGVIVCLWASPETILERTGNNNERPLLQVENPLQKIRELLDFRKPYYEQADIMVDTEDKSPLEVAEEILERMKILNSKQ